jgi:hypothetical protein
LIDDDEMKRQIQVKQLLQNKQNMAFMMMGMNPLVQSMPYNNFQTMFSYNMLTSFLMKSLNNPIESSHSMFGRQNLFSTSIGSTDTYSYLVEEGSRIQIRPVEDPLKFSYLNSMWKNLNAQNTNLCSSNSKRQPSASVDSTLPGSILETHPDTGNISDLVQNTISVNSSAESKIVEPSPENSINSILQINELQESNNFKSEPTSIVFNIRRYSKKHKKFILLTKHRKIITKCLHKEEEYYAKGMCKKCYHNKGERSKFAKRCGHTNRYHYAHGLCKSCYLSDYHKDRKTKE